MPALSKQQQKLFGLALAVKRGDVPKSDVSDEIKDIVKKFSNYIKLNVIKDVDINDAKKISYDKIIKKVDSRISL